MNVVIETHVSLYSLTIHVVVSVASLRSPSQILENVYDTNKSVIAQTVIVIWAFQVTVWRTLMKFTIICVTITTGLTD